MTSTQKLFEQRKRTMLELFSDPRYTPMKLKELAILLGGVLGALFGKFLNENAQETLTKVCGVSTLFIALSGAMEGMLRVENGIIVSNIMGSTTYEELKTIIDSALND